jgi:hypothetical protein
MESYFSSRYTPGKRDRARSIGGVRIALRMSEDSPSPPLRPKPSRPTGSNSTTLLALMAVLFLGGAFLGLIALVMPQAMAIVLVVGGLFVLPLVFHYLTWGWWLSQKRAVEKDEKQDR